MTSSTDDRAFGIAGVQVTAVLTSARVLRSTLGEIVPQDLSRDRPPGLGLSRGAGDFIWDSEDRPIVDKLHEIEAASDAAFDEAKARHEAGRSLWWRSTSLAAMPAAARSTPR